MRVPLIDLQAQYETIRSEVTAAVNGVLERQKFILDQQVSALESEIRELTQCRHAIACASGTDALLLSLYALQIKPGDEVITTAFSFFATAGMIAWAQAKPVFVDIDPKTMNISADDVARKISKKTKAIIAVDLFGQCSEYERLETFGLPVIEDAAQAIGAYRNKKAAGAFGSTGCFSFFPTKNLGGYGDGGLITTNNEDLASRLKELRGHGQRAEKYLHFTIGTNSRLDELQAAVLRVKLKYLSRWNDKRRSNAAYYMEQLKDLPIELPYIQEDNSWTAHQFVIRTEKRDQLKAALAEQGIGTAIYYPVALPNQPCFASLGYKPGDFPVAERAAATVLALPVYPELTVGQLDSVVTAVRSFY